MFNPCTFSIEYEVRQIAKKSIQNDEGGGIFHLFSHFPCGLLTLGSSLLKTYFLLHVEGRNGSSSCVRREISVTLINTLTLVTHTSSSHPDTNIKTVMVICHRRNLLICFFFLLFKFWQRREDRDYTFTRVTFFPVIGTKKYTSITPVPLILCMYAIWNHALIKY